MYGMTNSVKLFPDDLTYWWINEAGFKQYQCHMSIYCKYEPDGTKCFVLSYVFDCVYWYTYEAIGKCFADTLGKIFHVNCLGLSHWFMSVSISQLQEHSIIVD